ncbi:MAG: hypothetical protein NVSMB69_09790 [Novosphingobium sp.]
MFEHARRLLDCHDAHAKLRRQRRQRADPRAGFDPKDHIAQAIGTGRDQWFSPRCFQDFAAGRGHISLPCSLRLILCV